METQLTNEEREKIISEIIGNFQILGLLPDGDTKPTPTPTAAEPETVKPDSLTA